MDPEISSGVQLPDAQGKYHQIHKVFLRCSSLKLIKPHPTSARATSEFLQVSQRASRWAFEVDRLDPLTLQMKEMLKGRKDAGINGSTCCKFEGISSIMFFNKNEIVKVD